MRSSRRWLVVLMALVAVSTLTVGPALASGDDSVDFIRGYGSDTTYSLMTKLDETFNNALGCANIANNQANRTEVKGNGGNGKNLTSNPNAMCTPNFITPANQTPENFDHDLAMSYYPVGSGNGIVTLFNFAKVGNCGGSTASNGIDPFPGDVCPYLNFEYARSSGGRGTVDASLRFVAYAKDAIPWGNFRTGTTNVPRGCAFPVPANPAPGCSSVTQLNEANGPAGGVSMLTQQNLKDIFLNCKLTGSSPARQARWSDFGGTATPGSAADSIIVWADQDGSGTRKQFDTFLKLGSGSGDAKNCIPAKYKDGQASNGERVIFENDPTPIRYCSKTGPSCADGTSTTVVNGAQDTTTVCPAVGTTPCEPNLGADTDLSSIYYMSTGVYNTFPTDPAFGDQRALGLDLGGIDGTFANFDSITEPPVATCSTAHSHPGSTPFCSPVDGTDGDNPQGAAFVYARLLYNVYRLGNGGAGTGGAGNPVPPAALDYIGEKGWICKGSANNSGLSDAVSSTAPGVGDASTADVYDQRGLNGEKGGHTTNPQTNANYAVEIKNAIINAGFVPLAFGAISGGVGGNSHCRVF